VNEVQRTWQRSPPGHLPLPRCPILRWHGALRDQPPHHAHSRT